MNQSKKLLLLSLSMLCFSAKAMEPEVGAGVGGDAVPHVFNLAALTRQDALDLARIFGIKPQEEVPPIGTILRSMVCTTKNCMKTAVLALFVVSVVKFIITEPNNNPVRYSTSEIMQGKNLLKNLKYLILDGLIGHRGKRPSLRTYPDNKVSPELCEMYADQLKPSHQTVAVVLRPGAEAKGVYGYIYELAEPVLKATTMLAIIGTWQKGVTGGLNDFVRAGYGA